MWRQWFVAKRKLGGDYLCEAIKVEVLQKSWMPNMIKRQNVVPKYSHLLIFNTSNCIMNITPAESAAIPFLLCSQNNGSAYDVMLPQEGALS